jgi:ABC-2 type transport system permease protein
MRSTWAVCRREFVSYFITPLGYVVLALFAAIAGIAFTVSFIMHAWATQNPSQYGLTAIPDFEEAMLSPYLVFCGLLMMFLGPLVTMRLLAEEHHRGTSELLYTYPLRDRHIVFGKYLASLGILVVMIAIVGVYIAVIGRYVAVEPAVLAFGLLTVFLMGAAFFSWGLFVSALVQNPIVAALVTFGLWFISYILGAISERLPAQLAGVPEGWPEWAVNFAGFAYSLFRGLANHLALDTHARDMAQGFVTPAGIAYYLLFIAFFLFLAFRAVDSRRWRA